MHRSSKSSQVRHTTRASHTYVTPAQAKHRTVLPRPSRCICALMKCTGASRVLRRRATGPSQCCISALPFSTQQRITCHTRLAILLTTRRHTGAAAQHPVRFAAVYHARHTCAVANEEDAHHGAAASMQRRRKPAVPRVHCSSARHSTAPCVTHGTAAGADVSFQTKGNV